MNRITVFFCVIIFGLPALVLGYIWMCIKTGVKQGMFIFDKHENAEIYKIKERK